MQSGAPRRSLGAPAGVTLALALIPGDRTDTEGGPPGVGTVSVRGTRAGDQLLMVIFAARQTPIGPGDDDDDGMGAAAAALPVVRRYSGRL
jgi:hypothetical protein